MNLEELLARFAELRKMRDGIAEGFAADSDALRKAALQWFFAWLEDNPDAAIDDVLSEFEDTFHLPMKQQADLAASLREGQLKTMAARARIYADAGVNVEVNTTKLASSFRVDFPRIQREVRDLVMTKIERMSAAGSDVRLIEKELRASEIVSYQARTLSNTALAMSDNAHTHAIAEAANIDRFLYHGPASQRLFCDAHVGKIYTSTAIAEMSNGQGLSVETSCGGYNCRHEWLMIPPGIEPK